MSNNKEKYRSTELLLVKDMPVSVQDSFQYMAEYLLCEMHQHYSKVILVDAPEPKHVGHKIRQAVSFNPTWWSSLYNSQSVRLDRKRFQKALCRILRVNDRFGRYDDLARETIKEFLINGLYGEEPDREVEEFF